MNAVQTRNHTSHTSQANPATDRNIDWVGQCKLAIVLSVVAALATIALAGHVAEPVLIVGVIVVASVVAWARQEPAPRPAPLRVRSN